MLIELFLGDSTFFYFPVNMCNSLGHIGGHEKNIITCKQGSYLCFSWSESPAYAFHSQRIGKDKPLKSKGIAK